MTGYVTVNIYDILQNVSSRTCRTFTLVATIFSLHKAVLAEHLALRLEEARIIGQLDRS